MTPIEKILKAAGPPGQIQSRAMPDALSLMDIAAHRAHREGTVLLMSGGRQNSAQHHILGINPWLTLKTRDRNLELTIDGQDYRLSMDPFEGLRAITEHFRCRLENKADTPLAAGLMGYLAYDLKDNLETLPRTSVDRWRLPHMCLYAPAAILVQQTRTGQTMLHEFIRSVPAERRAADNLAATIAALDPKARPDESFSIDQALQSNFDQAGYEAAVEKIRGYIAAGDAYQVNLSQRFETSFEGRPFGFFRTLYEANPAPFFAFIHAGDHTVISTSPERFIKLTERRVETRPIKGTRPRGATPGEDRSMRDELIASAKDDAELSMIVDLLRNDLGRACRGGSVRVTAHKNLEAYANVYHLVSTVEGELDDDRDAIDLIRAVFPGGSITGCPKIRAMEIIDELEPDRRHVYTGSIGYISFHQTLDFSIAIRTAVICGDQMTFSVGGGVVYDSDPQAEYEETLHKGRTLINVCKTCAPFGRTTEWVWFNGRLCPAEEARLPVSGEGVRYGKGIFETIRADDGQAPLLTQHLARFEKSWRTLFENEPPDITWSTVIQQVLAKNALAHQTAALRLSVASSDRHHPYGGDLWITVRPYRHRLAALGTRGLDLRIYPEARQTPWADYKTLNYLFYLKAGEWARANGAHEALILNPDGSLSETNTANLLAIRNRTVLRPLSSHVLPGVMEECVCRELKAQGYRIEHKPMFPIDLYSADQVLLCNALMGVVPVTRLDDASLAEPTGLSRNLNAAIFGIPDVLGSSY
ncbi:MAG: aminodeoxychorismate synthase component I [Desulfobacterales bacterium]|nr:aminodeoxychorismate synthase component I [Desulfobacterales bacterium]